VRPTRAALLIVREFGKKNRNDSPKDNFTGFAFFWSFISDKVCFKVDYFRLKEIIMPVILLNKCNNIRPFFIRKNNDQPVVEMRIMLKLLSDVDR